MIIVNQPKLAERIPDPSLRSAVVRALEHGDLNELNDYVLQERLATRVPLARGHDEIPPKPAGEEDEG